jgi:hypothetical protein
MDKILEILAEKFTAEELNEVKKSIESTVDEKVQAKLDEETKVVAKKAEEFCQTKIKEAVEKKTAEIEEIANKFCAERCKELSEEANKKVESYKKKLEEASEQYIFEFFDQKFQEKYGKELEAIEEKVITGLDKYLEFNINEKISPALIQKTALSETYAPIIEGIKRLFEDEYVPMDQSGSKKIRELKAENTKLEESLKKQLDENMRLAELVESVGKKSLISEKISDLSAAQRVKVKKFFKEKSLNETKKDIDAYIEMIQEQTDSAAAMRYEKDRLFEHHDRPVRKTSYIEDRTQEPLVEKMRPRQPELSQREQAMLRSASLLDD